MSTYGISASFPTLFRTKGQVPTRYSPVRHSCIATSVRLACVKPAASVRSEPGSNSQVKRMNQSHKHHLLAYIKTNNPAKAKPPPQNPSISIQNHLQCLDDDTYFAKSPAKAIARPNQKSSGLSNQKPIIQNHLSLAAKTILDIKTTGQRRTADHASLLSFNNDKEQTKITKNKIRQANQNLKNKPTNKQKN